MRLACLLALLLFLFALPAQADPPTEDTIAALDAALAATPHDLGLVRQRGELLLREQQPARALEDLRFVLAITPDDAVTLVLEARALDALGRSDEALASVDRALALVPTSFAARRTRADLRARAGDMRGAIDDLDAALVGSDDQDAYLERARLLRLDGRASEAALGLDAALDATFHAPPMVLGAIDAWLEAGDAARALALVSDAETRSPTDPRWTIRRGDVLSRLGRDSEARATWQRALDAIDARLAARATVALVVDRGEALARLRRTSEARAALDDATARSPGYAPAQALAARLSEGGAR